MDGTVALRRPLFTGKVGEVRKLSLRRDLTLVQLIYFVVAADCGSMTRAAEELHVAQSAVSTAVANLERAVGVRLFIRQHAKGLETTAAGAELLVRARTILSLLDDAVEALQPESISGRLNVGCFRTLAPFFLPSIIQGMSEQYPQLKVEVVDLTADKVAAFLLNQTVEIALTYDLGLDRSIQSERLATVPMYAAVSRDHPFADRTSVRLAELAEQPMVMLDLPLSRDYFLQSFTAQGLRPEIRYRLDNFEAVRAMVAQGHGFTLLNQQPKGGYTYSGNELRHLRIEDEASGLDIVLAWSGEIEELSTKAELFAKQCRRSVSQSVPLRMTSASPI